MSDQQPSLAEIMQLARSIAAPPPPPQENGVLKAVTGVLSALVIALVLWVGSSISTLGTTMTKVSTNVDAMAKQIGDMQVTQQTTTGRIADMQASVAKNSSRIDALMDDQNRVRERIRILEGQRPLGVGGGG